MKYLLLFILLLNYNIKIQAQSFQYINDKSFGTTFGESQAFATRLGNKNIIAGYSSCSGIEFDKTSSNCSAISPDIWVVAFDDSLNIIWDKTFGGASDDRPYGITTFNNKILISGYTRSDTSCSVQLSPKGSFDYWVLIIDSLGNKLNEWRFGSSGSDQNCKIKPTLDGGYILMGASNGPADFDKSQACFGIYDYWVVKLDSSGNKQWDKIFGGNNIEVYTTWDSFNITCLSDSGYLIYGSTSSAFSGNVSGIPYGSSDAWIIKTNELGQIKWDKRIGGISSENISDIIELNNSYLIVGSTRSDSGGTINNIGFGNSDIWLMKSDTSGNIIWEQKYGTSYDDYGIKISKTQFGNYNILGEVTITGNGSFSSPSYGMTDYLVMNVDSSGNFLNYIILGSDSLDFPSSLIDLNDSTFLVCGSANHGITAVKHDIGKGATDYWAVKIGYSTTTGLNDLSQNLQLHLLTNPAHDYLEITGLPSDDYEVNIYSMEGRLLASKKQHADLSLTIPVSHFQSGMYLTEIRNKKLRTTVKWVKE